MSGSDPKRLPFLDGLRGLASLYVLLFHQMTLTIDGRGELSGVMKLLRAWFGEGHFSVVFFIVLSGFSLMLPLARAGVETLQGKLRQFAFRRARRIMPPYYAALLFSIALLGAYNLLAPRLGIGRAVEGALDAGSIISHLFLVHNLSFDWAYRINGPMWSVATEFQIYFLFAFAMLPLLRASGSIVVVIVSWVLGSLPFFLLPDSVNLFWACPWFVGSFALGMWGAKIAFAPEYAESFERERAPWGVLALAWFAVVVVVCWTGRSATWGYPIVDFVVSVFAFCWINANVQNVRQKPDSPSAVVRILGSRPLVELGAFSYSLYLIQHPVLRLMEKVLARLPLDLNALLAIQLVFGTPIVLFLAWLFAEFFERPFTGGGVVLPALRRRFAAAG